MARSTVVDDGVGEELKALKEDLSALRSDMKDLVCAVGGNTKDRLVGLKASIAEAAHRIRERANEGLHHAYDSVRDTGEKAVNRARDEVKTRPLSFLGFSFLVGLVLGFLVRRR